MYSMYYVYVIEMDKKVLNFKKFRLKIPLYFKSSGCVYIGQSIKSPSSRFEQHKKGYKSNSYVRRCGIKLLPELYNRYNPIPARRDAENIEKMLGERLRLNGIGVWFNWMIFQKRIKYIYIDLNKCFLIKDKSNTHKIMSKFSVHISGSNHA